MSSLPAKPPDSRQEHQDNETQEGYPGQTEESDQEEPHSYEGPKGPYTTSRCKSLGQGSRYPCPDHIRVEHRACNSVRAISSPGSPELNRWHTGFSREQTPTPHRSDY
ncbi:hypothetical protein QLX08_011623 [Tetragonisca angustula]|uniref:Uncharacterized protein n=1 Tax=Tetragonisca angustula TaxID=166442 RepID=A0AAW0Z7S9_9HYME